MLIRSLLRRLVPPLFVDWYRAWRNGTSPGPTWAGVYTQFAEISAARGGYDVEELVRQTRDQTAAVRMRVPRTDEISHDLIGEYNLLPLLVGVLCARSQHVTVLDFGGGAGMGFAHLLHGVPRCESIEYHVVELKRMCDEGRALWSHDRRIHFHETMPAQLEGLDIVYCCSALQYVDDYAGLLRAFCALRPRYMLFAKLSAGNVPTYVTAQRNLPDVRLPYRFLNFGEFLRIMATLNYRLAFKGSVERVYDQENFPQRYRLAHLSNVLFVPDSLPRAADG